MTTVDHALVTGYPRQLAKHIARDLARDPAARVTLLARARHLDEARRWCAGLADPSRVAVCEGDVTHIDLGLPGDEYLAMARSVTHVHHAAYATQDLSDVHRVEALNVQGTREVIELARTALAQGRAPRVVAYTSVQSLGDAQGHVLEETLDAGQRFRSPVEATLHKAERILRRAMETLPVTVARAAWTVGSSETGEVDRFDGPYLFILLWLNAPLDANLALPSRAGDVVQVVPVDYVARAGVALGREARAAGRTVHLVDPAPPTLPRFFERLSRAAGRQGARGFVPANLTRAILKIPGIDQLVKNPRAFLSGLATRAVYDARGARELLVPVGVECPSFDRYADVLVDHVRSRLAAQAEAPSRADEADDPLA